MISASPVQGEAGKQLVVAEDVAEQHIHSSRQVPVWVPKVLLVPMPTPAEPPT